MTVQDGDPVVVLGFGNDERREVFEWMADLETYDQSWWHDKVEPMLTAIAAGLVTHRIWQRGRHIVAVATSVQGDEPFEVYTRRGIRGILGGLAGTLNRHTEPSRIIHYAPWSDPAE